MVTSAEGNAISWCVFYYIWIQLKNRAADVSQIRPSSRWHRLIFITKRLIQLSRGQFLFICRILWYHTVRSKRSSTLWKLIDTTGWRVSFEQHLRLRSWVVSDYNKPITLQDVTACCSTAAGFLWFQDGFDQLTKCFQTWAYMVRILSYMWALQMPAR